MGMNMIVYQIVNEFKRLDEVVAITLAGSCASGRKDNYSDIDIDIITEILSNKFLPSISIESYST